MIRSDIFICLAFAGFWLLCLTGRAALGGDDWAERIIRPMTTASAAAVSSNGLVPVRAPQR